MVNGVSPDMRIAVVGLGYVGLPLALALAKHFDVVGYDSNASRVADLAEGVDRTGEITVEQLRISSLALVSEPAGLADCAVYIVTVPTPIDEANEPDLTALKAASRSVGAVLSLGDIVVYESTVYPGVTESVCGPELEAASGLTSGKDFYLGYSPERINPGDSYHTVDKITKIVAGQTPEVAGLLAEIYGSAISGIYIAPDIRTAEAAKVIENAQRDINIAFINEITMIFQRMGIDAHDVLEAARTKWNFLDFRPGLVGGHCIGVDPFYLAHAAKAAGHEPEIILAGRRINDSMAGFVAAEINRQLKPASKIMVLGLTFKENVPDLRNSKVADLIADLERVGHAIVVYDPVAADADARDFYDIELSPSLDDGAPYDAVVGAVAHDDFQALSPAAIEQALKPDGLLVDLKGIWRRLELAAPLRVWRL